MIRQELVTEEKWVSPQHFNRVLAMYQVLPGPEATELCVYFGMLSRGRIGGTLAGLGFVLPGFFLMFLLSWLYVRYGLKTTRHVRGRVRGDAGGRRGAHRARGAPHRRPRAGRSMVVGDRGHCDAGPARRRSLRDHADRGRTRLRAREAGLDFARRHR